MIDDRNRIITIVDFEIAERLGVRGIRSQRSTARLDELVDLCDRAGLIHVRRAFPLHEAAAAHREVETGHGRGKVVLTIDSA